MAKLYRLKTLFLDIGLIFVSIFLLFTLVPAILLGVILPLLIIRIFAVQTAKVNNNLGSPLSITSCHTAIDDIYGKPRCSLVAVFYLKEKLCVDKLLERVAKLLESSKVKNNYISTILYIYIYLLICSM